jgi:hypothetical protein
MRVGYEPFGNVCLLRAGASADDQPLRFPGQQVAFETPAGEENYNIFRWVPGGVGKVYAGGSGWFRRWRFEPVSKFTNNSSGPVCMTKGGLLQVRVASQVGRLFRCIRSLRAGEESFHRHHDHAEER